VAEANWRRRYRAASLSLPSWARLAPERLLYTSNGSGKTEVYAWDRAAGSQREVTDRPEGTTRAALEPPGERIWWFDDDRGSEHGVWRVEPFAGGPSEPAAPNLPAAYGAGLALARGFAVIGSSDDGGTRIHRAAGSVSVSTVQLARQCERTPGRAASGGSVASGSGFGPVRTVA